MGDASRLAARAAAVVGLLFFLSLGSIGCQQGNPVAVRRLIANQAMIDFSGLSPATEVAPVRAEAASPRRWEALPLQRAPLYAHQQWRSPTKRTGVGIAYVRMPLPLSAKAIVYFAKGEYTKKGKDGGADGRLIREWTDDLGRHWFEAQNAKYHVRGYALAKGFEAWIVYSGHRTGQTPDPSELSLAARTAESVVPLPRGMPTTVKPHMAQASVME